MAPIVAALRDGMVGTPVAGRVPVPVSREESEPREGTVAIGGERRRSRQ
jgi:hypothetical protein